MTKQLKGVATVLVAMVCTSLLFDPTLVAQSTSQSPTFEAASLKPTTDPHAPIGNFLTRPGGRLELVGCTLELMIMVAYKVDNFQILEGPRWVREDRFDMTAIPPPGSPSSTFIPRDAKLPPPLEELEMLKALMADRFQLKVHEETKEGPAFDLVLNGRALKLSNAKEPDKRPIVLFGTTGKPEKPYYFEGLNASMAVFADRLAGFLKRPVIDSTGLTGSYDFKVEMENEAGAGLSISSAVQDLGLKLVSAKGPNRFIVIDHAERPAQQ